jgi:hypothetical protein
MTMIAALLLAAALSAVPVVRVILRTGESIAVSGDIRRDGEKLLFRSPSGVLYSIALAEVDFEEMARPPKKDARAEPSDPDERHPARRLSVTPQERDRLLAELARKKRGDDPIEPEVISPQRPHPGNEPEQDDAAEEARWRAEARAARQAVQARKDEIEALKRRATQLEDELRTLLSSGYDPNLLSAQAVELEATRSRLEHAQEELRDAQRNLTDLQDRARKAGIVPGWLRD